jgi:bis(5'-nucleosidyl)-tetraphosphatase
MIEEQSFGIIPLSRRSGIWYVLLIQHAHGKYWGFPKGHAEAGETHRASAERELKEETNLEVVKYLSTEPLMEAYSFTHKLGPVSKKVFYFVAEVQGKIVLQAHEVQDARWVKFEHAHNEVTHPEAKAIVEQVAKILATL